MTFQRYLVRQMLLEMGGVLFVGLLLLCTSRLVNHADDVLNGRLEFWAVLSAIGLRIPEFMLACGPLAVVVGSYLVLSRMWAQNEVSAANYAGVSLIRIEWLAVLMALGGMVITLMLSIWLVPLSSQRAATLLEESKVRSSLLYLDTGYFHQISDTWYMFVGDREKRHLLNTVAVERGRNGDVRLVWSDVMDIGDCRLLEACSLNISWPEGLGKATTNPDGTLKVGVTVAEMELPYSQRRGLERAKSVGLPDSASLHTQLQWHLATALYMLIMTLMILPLARVPPRQPRFRYLLAVILLTLLYLVLVLGARRSLGAGNLLPEPGIWPVHGFFLLLALALGPVGTRLRQFVDQRRAARVAQ